MMAGSIFFPAVFLNYSSAQAAPASCGKPNYRREINRGIFLWRNCSTQVWSFRVSSGGRPAGDEFKVAGRLQLNKPFAFLDGFSLDPGVSGSQDLFDTSDPNKVDFIFRVWGEAQDGFNFKLLNNTIACLTISAPSTTWPIVIGRSNLFIRSPLNLDTLDSSDCTNITPSLYLLIE